MQQDLPVVVAAEVAVVVEDVGPAQLDIGRLLRVHVPDLWCRLSDTACNWDATCGRTVVLPVLIWSAGERSEVRMRNLGTTGK